MTPTTPRRSGDGTHSDRRESCHLDYRELGSWMYAFASELFPICRSITGNGLRATLRRIQREIPITIHEVLTGTPVLDWTIPDEWNVRDAWISNSRGERVVDFRVNNLHVVNYSAPIRARMSLRQLRPYLHTLPEYPECIPYRTSYYKRTWGFCLSHHQLQQLEDGEYDVCIDSTLAPGALSYGELLIRGESEDEFLISVHCCHPSLANDNLSGTAVAVALARAFGSQPSPLPSSGPSPLHHSYRFLFIPGTIGAITWLARNGDKVARIKAGLVLACAGDSGSVTYKKSRDGNALIDSAMQQVLGKSGESHRVLDFVPYGYDERQYCSPGFNLPIGCFMRSQNGTFPEYHTSADNMNFIKAEALADSLKKLLCVIDVIEDGSVKLDLKGSAIPSSRLISHASRYVNLKPKGEPHLGKYGLYEAFGGDVMPALWVLSFSDGTHSLSEISAKSSLPVHQLARVADILCARGLVKEVGP